MQYRVYGGKRYPVMGGKSNTIIPECRKAMLQTYSGVFIPLSIFL